MCYNSVFMLDHVHCVHSAILCCEI
jgi:hypothetical protein